MKKWTVQPIQRVWGRLRPHPSMSKKEHALRYALMAAIWTFVALTVFTMLYALWILLTFNPGSAQPKDSTLIMDRAGNLLYTIHGEENRESLKSLDDISPSLVDATIAIEDDGFYGHMGVDFPALFKAVLSEVGIGAPRGGSTITQQLVKNTILSAERSYIRKYREILISLALELKYSKDEILLMYLNEIPYGNNAYGVELAAERYFDKSAAELNLAESAVLASIPKAPTRYSPYGNYKYSVLNFELTVESLGDRKIAGEEDLDTDDFTRGLLGKTYEMPDGSTFYIKGRSDLVLERMRELKMITEKEGSAALAEIQTMAFTTYADSIRAAHFVLWVKQQLEEKYGAEVVEQGGLKVYTTLDPDFQKAAEEAIAERMEVLNDTYGASNAALVTVQPQTGQILAMVGSANWGDEDIDGQVNMITSPRQPGSSFKPFVYSLALLNQYTAATVFYDVKTNFGSYQPNNFDGKFWGPMTMRYALGQSRNIPAIKAYFLAGEETAIATFVNKLGLTSVQENGNYGPTLALGTAEVTPLEMAEGYSVFANNGVHVAPTSILKIETNDGKILEQWDEKKVEKTLVLDPQVAYIIDDILSDSKSGLGPNMYIDALNNAAKTGTSNVPTTNGGVLPNNNWIAAYTPTLVTIGWAGNADGTALKSNGESYSTIAPIWKNYMSKVLTRLEPTEWVRPEGVKELAISKASGKLPGNSTPSDMIATEIFADFAVPTQVDDAYQTLDIETLTGRLATEFSPPDLVQKKSFRVHKEDWIDWQSFIDAWAKGNDQDQPPTEFANDIHNATTAAKVPEITITYPTALSSLSIDERLHTVEVQIQSFGNGLKEVEYSLNGSVQYHSAEAPYSGKIRMPITATAGTLLEITAKAIDQYGYSAVSTIEVRVSNDSSSSDSTSDVSE